MSLLERIAIALAEREVSAARTRRVIKEIEDFQRELRREFR